jgi:hypothetical protein
VDLLAVRGDLDPGGAQVAGVRQALDQARVVEHPDDAGDHRGIQPLELGEIGETERASGPDQGEHRVLGGGQALPGGGVVKLARELADHRAEPGYEFNIHAGSSNSSNPELDCLLASK